MPRTRDEASHPRASTRTRELLYLLLQFLVFLAIYTLFSAGSFYKADGQQLLLQMRAGTYDWPYHPLYLPLFYGFRSLIDACGGASLTLFEKAEALSACTASLGLVFCYLAFLRLGLTAAKARFGTWILGLIPCVVLFSTVVEVHAPFFCFAALSFLAFAQFDRRPTLFYAILLGLSTAFATGFHATGLLWPSALLPLFLVRRWKLCLANERWAILGLATIAGATHLLLHYGFAALWQSLDWLSDPEASAQLVAKGFSKERGLAYLPLVFYREFLLGLLPLSLFPLLLPFARERKKELLALVPALVLYLLLCSYLIASEPEFGAYLLPLAIPIAWLSASVLRPSLLVILLLSAALLSYTLVPRSGLGDEVAYRSFAESVQSEARGGPVFLLLGSSEELGASLAWLEGTEQYALHEVGKLDLPSLELLLPVFDRIVREKRSQGMRVLLTRAARSYLQNAAASLHGAGPAFWEHLKKRYELQPTLRSKGLGWILVPR